MAPQPQTEAHKVRGLGVSPGTYEGTARVIRDTSEFGRIEPGDVLVTNSTTTAFNIVLPLLGAIVTDRGGLLSHAAIVAREYGIAGVVGCTDATRVLPDGALVRVDGAAGRGRGLVVRLAPLEESLDAELYGGKAAQLALAVGAGLPVPRGRRILGRARRGDRGRCSGRDRRARARLAAPPAPLAVRSSAVGEDSEEASFAGQHLTCLNVRSAADGVEAVEAIWRSAHSDSALAYRRRLGLTGSPRIAVVVQQLVDADCAGVLFTRNPLDGADELVVEAAWGLGEAVVAGLVTPDRFRVARDGTVLERVAGRRISPSRLRPWGYGRGRDLRRAGSSALPRRQPARGAGSARRAVRPRVRGRPRPRVGIHGRRRSTCFSAGRSRAPPCSRPDESTRLLFATWDGAGTLCPRLQSLGNSKSAGIPFVC